MFASDRMFSLGFYLFVYRGSKKALRNGHGHGQANQFDFYSLIYVFLFKLYKFIALYQISPKRMYANYLVVKNYGNKHMSHQVRVSKLRTTWVDKSDC